jgi:hypothetical protein
LLPHDVCEFKSAIIVIIFLILVFVTFFQFFGQNFIYFEITTLQHNCQFFYFFISKINNSFLIRKELVFVTVNYKFTKVNVNLQMYLMERHIKQFIPLLQRPRAKIRMSRCSNRPAYLPPSKLQKYIFVKFSTPVLTVGFNILNLRLHLFHIRQVP